ncbi:MAG: haloacid dehalogenase-like hydrolase [Candidatus Acidiferrales bacterium]|jgi:phosphoserine phosphatase
MSAKLQAGAFFDIDGTLLPWPSLEWRFIAYLASRDILGPAAAARSVGIAIDNASSGLPLATGNRMYLSGLSTSLVDDWLADLSRPLPILVDGLRRLEWHASQGHRIVLISGTLAPLARAFALRIGSAEEICATELDTVSGADATSVGFGDDFWTGRLASEWPNGKTKAHIVRRIADGHHLDLARSFAYGDSASDAAMLASVRYPRAVNPSLALRRIAADHRWIIEYWKLRAASSAANFADRSTIARAGEQR